MWEQRGPEEQWSRNELVQAASALSEPSVFLAQTALIGSNLGSGKKFMGIIHDQQRELLGTLKKKKTNIIPFKLI